MAINAIEFMRNQLLSCMKQTGAKMQIIQQPIPAELQFAYAADYQRFAPMMQQLSEQELNNYIDKALVTLYFSHDCSLKRDVLTKLSAIKLPKAYSVLKQFGDDGAKDLRDWAAIALMGSRLNLTEDFTGDNMVFVVSGMGGVNDSIRYNLVLFNRLDRPFSEFERSLITKECQYHLAHFSGQPDSLDVRDRYARLVFLMPISESPRLFLEALLAGINEFQPIVDCPDTIKNEMYYSDAYCMGLVEERGLCLVV